MNNVTFIGQKLQVMLYFVGGCMYKQTDKQMERQIDLKQCAFDHLIQWNKISHKICLQDYLLIFYETNL